MQDSGDLYYRSADLKTPVGCFHNQSLARLSTQIIGVIYSNGAGILRLLNSALIWTAQLSEPSKFLLMECSKAFEGSSPSFINVMNLETARQGRQESFSWAIAGPELTTRAKQTAVINFMVIKSPEVISTGKPWPLADGHKRTQILKPCKFTHFDRVSQQSCCQPDNK